MKDMAGWKLKEGSTTYGKVSTDQLWTVMNRTFSSQSKKTTSYKYALIRALLESLYQVDENLRISFDVLATSFSKLYWNLIIKHKYAQWTNARIHTILSNIKLQNQLPDEIPYDHLSILIKNEVNTAIQKDILNKYVLGALYKDTEGLLYGFNKKDKIVQFNPSGYEFLLKYQEVLFRLNNYELTKFIQSRNESQSNEVIINNIENITKRESLTDYRELLLAYSAPRCFYTNAKLVVGKGRIVVDHFIPWSFVHCDNLWNLVLTTPSLNSKKSNKLPSNEYVNKLFLRNEQLIKSNDQNVREEFAKYKKSTVEKLYDYAEINGFQTGWTP